MFCKDWHLTRYPQYKISLFQKKAARKMNLEPFNVHTTPLFKSCIDINFINIINVEYCIFVNNWFNIDSFLVFAGTCKLALAAHSYNNRSAINSHLFAPSNNSVIFGRKSIIHSMTFTWNHLQNKLTEYDILSLSPKSLRILLLKFFILAYDN